MKTIKNGIKFLLIILLVFFFTICITMLFLLKNNKENLNEDSYNTENIEGQKNDELILVKDNNTYKLVQTCIEKLLAAIKEEDVDTVIKTIENSFASSNNIAKDTLNNFIIKLGKYQKFYIYQINEEKESQQVSRFFVKGKLAVGYDKKENLDMYFIVRVDFEKSVFSIIPVYQNEKIYGDVTELQKDYVKYRGELLENDSNKFQNKQVTNEYMASEYFSNFQYRIIYDSENFYGNIDETYREKRFSNIDEYKQYIKDNYNNIENLTLQQYKVEKKDGYTEYICLDNHETYFTIRAKGVMDYTIVLDDYTIKSEEFIEAYNNSKEEEKVYTNIEIFTKMINNKDYKAAYAMLNQEFKDNNFKILEDFQNYIKETFFEYATIESVNNIKKSGKYYICTVTMSTGNSLGAEKKAKTFFVAIRDAENLEISFEVN